MKANRFLGIYFVFLVVIVNAANGQEFFSGTKGTNTIISRTGRTTLGYALFRSSSDGTQVLEHSNEVGNFYIRSVAYQVPEDSGNLILNDIGGFVGIGTSRPKEKLSVNGNIRAREIKVETTNWPDYVFEEGYDLPNLKEVEAFIKENGHLPEIPKAAEIQEEGLSLGEMNKLLLKKIEELTLYLIENEKESTLQKERINHLEEAVEKYRRK